MRARLVLAAGLLAACSNSAADGRRGSLSPLGPVPADAQRTGDAARGYRALVEGSYVGCGVPLSAYKKVFDPAPAAAQLPDRTGDNRDLPYNFTAFRTESGVSVVTPNCLQCHAEFLHGELVIGLGNHTTDFTLDVGLVADLAGTLVEDAAERSEWRRWAQRIKTVAPYVATRTIGVNPADNLAAVLFAHRDRDTLAWSEEPLLPLPPPTVVPVDVPPWWHMRKKNAMFYTAAGRGDHSRIMMTASTLCVDSVERARAIDSYFPDVRAFLLSLTPPSYPFEIDRGKAARGRILFEGTCAGCHGTYGQEHYYPNLVIGTDVVGTDDALALGASQFAGEYVDWFNESFFGELARLAPAPGYVAPPLDGVWATAPYFHNGSVPTLMGVLRSDSRPTYWSRSFSTDDFDREQVGWVHWSVAADELRTYGSRAYNTTIDGYRNTGHPFGDAFSDAERGAVLEYLKTL